MENLNINIGKWLPEEHQLFLKELVLVGKDWKHISQIVSTRTEQQVRSHAQKFMNKLNRRSDSLKRKKTNLSVEDSLYKRIFDGAEL